MARTRRGNGGGGTTTDVGILPECAPPDTRVPPQFLVFFRRHVPITPPLLVAPEGDESPPLQLACVGMDPSSVVVSDAYDVRLVQTWTLQKLALGDLSSTIALAPGEELTLEFQVSQRRVLEQDTIDSAETQDQTESTTIDKEVMSVARSASHNHSWHVDGSGSFSYGPASATVSAGVSDSVTQTSQSSMEHTNEATRKSAHTLKTLHKVEVRGVTEGAISNRMTRKISNPYRDRTLSVNVFQLVKQFAVETRVDQVRRCVVVHVERLTFDDHFVIANGGFLRDNLLDLDLADNLAIATQAATPQHAPASEAARDVAKAGLYYLFEEPSIFNVKDINGTDANLPANSFDAAPMGADAGLEDSLRNDLAPIFSTLNFFYKVYGDMANAGSLDANAVSMATALAGAVSGPWQAFVSSDATKDERKNILDQDNFTEPFRRLPGFLAMIDGMLRPLLGPAEEEQQVAADQAKGLLILTKLLDHLECNRNYYLQRFLAYVSTKTANQAIVDFVNALAALPGMNMGADEISKFDIERAFIDRQDIIIPAFDPEDIGEGSSANDDPLRGWVPPPPQTVNVEVPSDGIHLEVGAGVCLLADVPPADSTIDLSVKDASLHVVQA